MTKRRTCVCQSVHQDARREISRLEAQIHREREAAAEERASLHARARDLEEKMARLLKREASRSSPPHGSAGSASTPSLELSARGGASPQRAPPPPARATGSATERGDDLPAAPTGHGAVLRADDRGAGSQRGPADSHHPTCLFERRPPSPHAPPDRSLDASLSTPEDRRAPEYLRTGGIDAVRESAAAQSTSPGMHARGDCGMRKRPGGDGEERGGASPRMHASDGRGRETTPKSVIFDILKRASSSSPRNDRQEPMSRAATAQDAPSKPPKSKEDEGYMLVAAAVTMAPREEQVDFLLSLSEAERSGALRWMDPLDLARALALCQNGDDLLSNIPLTVLKPVFECMESPDRYMTLQQVCSAPKLSSLESSHALFLFPPFSLSLLCVWHILAHSQVPYRAFDSLLSSCANRTVLSLPRSCSA